jgi:hypothetical protein
MGEKTLRYSLLCPFFCLLGSRHVTYRRLRRLFLSRWRPFTRPPLWQLLFFFLPCEFFRQIELGEDSQPQEPPCREAETAAAEMWYFWGWACRGRLRRKASVEIRMHKRSPAFAITVTSMCCHWCGRQSASPCPSYAGGKQLAVCQLNCVAFGPSIPGPDPVYPSRAIEPCSSCQSVQVVRAGDGARIRCRSLKWERG